MFREFGLAFAREIDNRLWTGMMLLSPGTSTQNLEMESAPWNKFPQKRECRFLGRLSFPLGFLPLLRQQQQVELTHAQSLRKGRSAKFQNEISHGIQIKVILLERNPPDSIQLLGSWRLWTRLFHPPKTLPGSQWCGRSLSLFLFSRTYVRLWVGSREYPCKTPSWARHLPLPPCATRFPFAMSSSFVPLVKFLHELEDKFLGERGLLLRLLRILPLPQESATVRCWPLFLSLASWMEATKGENWYFLLAFPSSIHFCISRFHPASPPERFFFHWSLSFPCSYPIPMNNWLPARFPRLTWVSCRFAKFKVPPGCWLCNIR